MTRQELIDLLVKTSHEGGCLAVDNDNGDWYEFKPVKVSQATVIYFHSATSDALGLDPSIAEFYSAVDMLLNPKNGFQLKTTRQAKCRLIISWRYN